MVRAAVVMAVVAVGVSVGTLGLVGAPVGGGPPVAAPVGGVPSESMTREGPGTPGGGGPDGTAHARTYRPPLDPPVVVARPFDGPAQPWAPGHRGVDLAAHVGQLVRAPEAGVVTFAGTVVDRGVVTVTHDDGLRSSLEPVTWGVAAGRRVLAGQVVGTVGTAAGHCAPATCLHWGLRRGRTYLDPMQWVLDRGPIVLLPER